MIENWELGVLWLNEVSRLGDEEKAAQSVRKKYFDEMCNDSKETRFFMGTVFPYNTWIVLGVFWPPKSQARAIQTTLF
jgi:N-acetylneuraminic acid mutarotase